MSSATLKGQCFCGHVRFSLTGGPRYACHCHCRSCQRAAGAPFVTWVSFARSDLDITDGTIAEHQSAPGVQRGHCAQCGTTLTYAHIKRPGEIDIAVASLDDSTSIVPLSHIWVEDKAPWLEIGDALPKYRTTATAGDLLP